MSEIILFSFRNDFCIKDVVDFFKQSSLSLSSYTLRYFRQGNYSDSLMFNTYLQRWAFPRHTDLAPLASQ